LHESTSRQPTHKPSQFRILLRCFGYLRPYWKLTGGAYLMMLLIDTFT